jgi:hypothetical protein
MNKSELRQIIKEEITQHQEKMIVWFKDRWKDYSINQLKKELDKSFADKGRGYLVPMIKDLIKTKK